jgi:hypothetical protein
LPLGFRIFLMFFSLTFQSFTVLSLVVSM